MDELKDLITYRELVDALVKFSDEILTADIDEEYANGLIDGAFTIIKRAATGIDDIPIIKFSSIVKGGI